MKLAAREHAKLCKIFNFEILRGLVSKETVVLRRWGVLQDNLVLSTKLIMVNWSRKLTFRALALLRSESRNCGFCVLYIQKDGATLLVGAW